jgi:hypothetical protein
VESWAVTALPQIRVARIGIRRKERQNRPAANPQKIDRGRKRFFLQNAARDQRTGLRDCA